MHNNDDELELKPPEQPDWQRREPSYKDFDDDGEFEDSDRDTDFASMYTEVDSEEEPEYFVDPPETKAEPEPETASLWEPEDELEPEEEKRWGDGEPRYEDEGYDDIAAVPPEGDAPDLEEEWQEAEELFEDDGVQEVTWPLGLIIVAVVALVLLGAGGYGVMQQRAALQEEIRQLQARLATSAGPQEVSASRNSVADMKRHSRELETEVEALTRENRSLEAIVSGLETQLEAQQEATVKPAPSPKPAPAPKQDASPVAKPAAGSSSTTTVSDTGGWFVNFGSYRQKERAEGWAKRLQADYGNVVVTTGQKDGITFFRVRVIGLASREAAEAIARKLEQEHDLSKLWVGKG